jgi:hypothetical protein
MRRSGRPPQSPRIFRGAELARLITGLVMLVVLYMLIMRARDANTWRWLARDDGRPTAATAPAEPEKKPAEPEKQPIESGKKRIEPIKKPTEPGKKPVPAPAPQAPAVTGPTDQDPEEAETAREEFQALTDGTLKLGPEEMEPYDRLVEWVKNQSFAQLSARAKKGLRYSNLYDDPDRHRGELVALDVEIRLASDAGKNRYGVPLYEAWGATNESRGRLYALIIEDYPKGMPAGDSICEKARFVGYFLKLQGYEPATAKPGQKPEKAPLLIGRVQWEPVVAPRVDTTREWLWGLPLLAMVLAVFVFQWAYFKWFRRRPAVRPVTSRAADGDILPIESWLDRPGFGAEREGSSRPSDPLDGGGQEG